ncbi:diguanylate cyclase [Billgrantia diversa]|uniref:sensor domain-containing diguanylate cyclase n=1 Tax=Halomonas sp. MCCC 1A13316 TaxID=2733487 RepID=UPI0018A46C4E|nr:diguanylate cyclase [Halomonas sp. MCCC 1A13316]QOR38522.1 diguanylate cyclase [Halomonas sp. MCCC 1A13316]
MDEGNSTASGDDDLSRLLDVLPLPVLVARDQQEWRLLYANAAARRYFGLSDGIVDQPLLPLLGDVDRHALEAALAESELTEIRVACQGVAGKPPFEALPGRATWQQQEACQLTLVPLTESSRSASEPFYKQMFNTNPAIKMLIDPVDGRIVDANAAAVSFYGYSLNALKQLKITDINCQSSAEVRASMARAKTCQQLFFEFRHRLANGEVRDVRVYSGPVHFQSREYLHSIVVDVTDEKRYCAQLEGYNDLFHDLPVGIYRHTAGPKGRFTAANPAMLRIFEADSRQALFAAPITSLYECPRQIHEFMDDLAQDGAVIRRPLRLRTLKGRSIHAEVTAYRKTAVDGSIDYSGIVEDVTARHAAQANQDRLTHLLDASPDIVSIVDADQRVVYLNKAGREQLGVLPEALSEALIAAHPLWARRLIQEKGIPYAIEHGHWYAETAVLGCDGEVPVSQLIITRRDESGKVESIATIMRDISQAKRYQAELEYHAGHDPLTGAFNRNRFIDLLGRERQEVRRDGRPLSLVMFDIDHFKRVNDTFGHSVGDMVLAKLVRTCHALLREVDVLARWGGEEFMLLLPGTPLAGAATLAERLRRAVEEEDFAPAPCITSSFGVAELDPDETDTQCYKRLDEALYRAKANGRNQVCLAEPLNDSVERRQVQ